MKNKALITLFICLYIQNPSQAQGFLQTLFKNFQKKESHITTAREQQRWSEKAREIHNKHATTYDETKYPLHNAVQQKQLERVKKILRNDVDIYLQDEKGETALHTAIRKLKASSTSNTENNTILNIIGALLKEESKRNKAAFFWDIKNICSIQNNNNQDPIDLSFLVARAQKSETLWKVLYSYLITEEKKHTFFDEELLEYSPFKGTPLINKMNSFFIRNDIPYPHIETTISTTSHPLHNAIKEKNFTQAQNLLDEGINIYQQDSDGNTPLHLLMMYYNVRTDNAFLSILEAILQEEKKINKQTLFIKKNICAITNNNNDDVIDLAFKAYQRAISKNEFFNWNLFTMLQKHLLEESKMHALFRHADDLLKKIETIEAAHMKHVSTPTQLPTRQKPLFQPTIPKQPISQASSLQQETLSTHDIPKPLPLKKATTPSVQTKTSPEQKTRLMPTALEEQLYPLHSAVRNNNVPLVAILLNSGHNLYQQDKEGNTALHEAIVQFNNPNAQHEIISLILKKEAFLNATKNDIQRIYILTIPNKYNKTPLDVALHAYILNKKENISFDPSVFKLFESHIQEEAKRSPLFDSDALLKKIQNPLNAIKRTPTSLTSIQSNKTIDTNDAMIAKQYQAREIRPLHVAIAENNAEEVDSYLKVGTDIYTQDEYGNTPLHQAIIQYYQSPQNEATQVKIVTKILEKERSLQKRTIKAKKIYAIKNYNNQDSIDLAIHMHKHSNSNNKEILKTLQKHIETQIRSLKQAQTDQSLRKLKAIL